MAVTTISEATENVVHQLRGRATDLVSLVDTVRRRPLHVVVIPAEVVMYWRREDPSEWQMVLEWLTSMNVEVHLT